MRICAFPRKGPVSKKQASGKEACVCGSSAWFVDFGFQLDISSFVVCASALELEMIHSPPDTFYLRNIEEDFNKKSLNTQRTLKG